MALRQVSDGAQGGGPRPWSKVVRPATTVPDSTPLTHVDLVKPQGHSFLQTAALNQVENWLPLSGAGYGFEALFKSLVRVNDEVVCVRRMDWERPILGLITGRGPHDMLSGRRVRKSRVSHTSRGRRYPPPPTSLTACLSYICVMHVPWYVSLKVITHLPRVHTDPLVWRSADLCMKECWSLYEGVLISVWRSADLFYLKGFCRHDPLSST